MQQITYIGSDRSSKLPLLQLGYITPFILNDSILRSQKRQAAIDLYKAIALQNIVDSGVSVADAAIEFDAVDKLFGGAFLMYLPEDERFEAQAKLKELADTTSLDYKVDIATAIIQERLVHHVTLAVPYSGSDCLYAERGWGEVVEGDRIRLQNHVITIKSVQEFQGDLKLGIEPIGIQCDEGSTGLILDGIKRYRVGAMEWTRDRSMSLSQSPVEDSQIEQIYRFFTSESDGNLVKEEEAGKDTNNPFILNPDLPISSKLESPNLPDMPAALSLIGDRSISDPAPSVAPGLGTNSSMNPSTVFVN